MRTVVGLSACVMLSLGCSTLPRQAALPDPRVPHRIAEETAVRVWVRRPDGALVTERVRLMPGWYCAGPQVVEGPAP